MLKGLLRPNIIKFWKNMDETMRQICNHLLNLEIIIVNILRELTMNQEFSKYFMYNNIFDPHNYPKSWMLLFSPFYK